MGQIMISHNQMNSVNLGHTLDYKFKNRRANSVAIFLCPREVSSLQKHTQNQGSRYCKPPIILHIILQITYETPASCSIDEIPAFKKFYLLYYTGLNYTHKGILLHEHGGFS